MQRWYRRGPDHRPKEPLVSYHASVSDLIDFVSDHLEPDPDGSTLELFGDPQFGQISPEIMVKLESAEAVADHGIMQHDISGAV